MVKFKNFFIALLLGLNLIVIVSTSAEALTPETENNHSLYTENTFTNSVTTEDTSVLEEKLILAENEILELEEQLKLVQSKSFVKENSTELDQAIIEKEIGISENQNKTNKYLLQFSRSLSRTANHQPKIASLSANQITATLPLNKKFHRLDPPKKQQWFSVNNLVIFSALLGIVMITFMVQFVYSEKKLISTPDKFSHLSKTREQFKNILDQ